MKTYSLDLETFLISDEVPFPKPVCLSWQNHEDPADCGVVGNNSHYAINEKSELEVKLRSFLCWASEENYRLVWQNGFQFDLPVIWTHLPELRKFLLKALDKNAFSDTLVREKLLDLSTSGRVRRKGYSLSSMARKYLARDIDTWKQGENIWRLRYNELDGIPASYYPKEALEYCLMDVQVQRDVWEAQERLRQPEGVGSANTEGLQIRAGFVLSLATARGLKVDRDALDEFENSIDEKLNPLRKKLIELEFAKVTAKGVYAKQNKKFIEYLTAVYPDFVTRTDPTATHPKGQVRVDDEALSEYPEDDVIRTRLDMSLLEKYKGTYCKNIRRKGLTFREPYDIIKETGRTSSFIQTMPREGGVREIFVAREGYKLVTIDYAAIEACAIAQTMKDLGLGTSLLEYLNEGEEPADYHSLLGHLWYAYRKGVAPNLAEFVDLRRRGDQAAKEARNQSKPGGLSIAGGVGNATMCKIAKASGVDISEDDAQIFRDFAYDLMPEIRSFLKTWVNDQKVSGDFDYAYGYSCNGRFRNRCTYCACANGRSMQSPAADGAKEAIWSCFKLCQEMDSYLVGFVHDEIIFEVSERMVQKVVSELAREMCKGMKKILPDIRITTEWAIMSRWAKSEEKHEARGKVWVN